MLEKLDGYLVGHRIGNLINFELMKNKGKIGVIGHWGAKGMQAVGAPALELMCMVGRDIVVFVCISQVINTIKHVFIQ